MRTATYGGGDITSRLLNNGNRLWASSYAEDSGKIVLNFTQSAQQTAHSPFHDMLPQLHAIYNDVILLNVLTEV
jgi:hypothetical protein